MTRLSIELYMKIEGVGRAKKVFWKKTKIHFRCDCPRYFNEN